MKSEGYLPSRLLVLTYKELDIELIPMSTARLEKPVVAQLVKKFSAFRLTIVFTKAMDRILSQGTSSHPFLVRSILILFFHMYIRFLSEKHLTSYSIKNLSAFLTFPIRADFF